MTKVSGLIDDQDHSRLGEMAAARKTTIGILVTYAVRRLIREYNDNPKLGAHLERDGRRRSKNGSNN